MTWLLLPRGLEHSFAISNNLKIDFRNMQVIFHKYHEWTITVKTFEMRGTMYFPCLLYFFVSFKIKITSSKDRNETYPKEQRNSLTNSRALNVEWYTKLINAVHNLLIVLADLYVVLKKTCCDFTRCAGHFRHHWRLYLHHHLL